MTAKFTLPSVFPNAVTLNRRQMLSGAAATSMCGAFSASGWSSAVASLPGDMHQFEIVREGSTIGRHSVKFDGTEQDFSVDIEIAIEVGLGPLTLYRYEHKNREVWRNGRFYSFQSVTNDDGERFAARAQVREGSIDLDIAVDDTPSQQTSIARVGLLPTTYWNYDTVKASHLLGTQDGEIHVVSTEIKGREWVDLGGAKVRASRYDMTGDLEMSLWYDDNNTWVKIAFDYDGARFDYRPIA